MAKYRKKPIEIEATQWFCNGDHPEDYATRDCSAEEKDYEGDVIKRFRRPDVSSDKICSTCGFFMEKHGWIDTLEGGHVVCPGDFIITGVQGERYPCKPDIFQLTYELVK